jgi:hypothetical protein
MNHELQLEFCVTNCYGVFVRTLTFLAINQLCLCLCRIIHLIEQTKLGTTDNATTLENSSGYSLMAKDGVKGTISPCRRFQTKL